MILMLRPYPPSLHRFDLLPLPVLPPFDIFLKVRRLIARIQCQATELRRFTYGKHILSRVEKEVLLLLLAAPLPVPFLFCANGVL